MVIARSRARIARLDRDIAAAQAGYALLHEPTGVTWPSPLVDPAFPQYRPPEGMSEAPAHTHLM